MDRGEIFGYLKYLGYPYNCMNSPSKKQYFCYVLLISICVLDICTIINQHTRKFLKEVGWVRFLVTTFFIISHNTILILCLYRNIKSNHPLNKIVDKIQIAIQFHRLPKSDLRWLHVGFTLVTIHGFCKMYSLSSQKFLLKSYNDLIKTFISYCHLGQFVIPLNVLSKMMSQLRDFLAMYHSRTDKRLCEDTWAQVLKQIRLEEIYSQLVDTYFFYLVLIVFDHLFRTCLGLFLLAGIVLDLVPEALFISDSLRTPVIFTHFALIVESLFKIWVVAHTAANVNNEREKFYADLYSLCLEDKRGFLLRHDLIVIQLERRRLMHPKPQKFFPLDHSLFYHMLSNAVGCVFIIVQFQIHDSCSEM
ncbi:Gustatory receptor 190b [Halyomorpha halys]|nr:Gustatory receptor 190b [Halyomorpha halys]